MGKKTKIILTLSAVCCIALLAFYLNNEEDDTTKVLYEGNNTMQAWDEESRDAAHLDAVNRVISSQIEQCLDANSCVITTTDDSIFVETEFDEAKDISDEEKEMVTKMIQNYMNVDGRTIEIQVVV